MTGDFWLGVLRNDLVGVRAKGGRIFLSPKERVTRRHREIVRKHRADLLLALAAWGGEAPPRNLLSTAEPPRPDEIGRESRRRPVVVTGRRR